MGERVVTSCGALGGQPARWPLPLPAPLAALTARVLISSAMAASAAVAPHLAPYVALVKQSRLLAANLKEATLVHYTGNTHAGNKVAR